ncbi:nicotinamide riboside transporter PnuC [Weissella oryzae]|nr:nicotinamide riboside transporter PnuC [Weissella oryzae]
MEISHQVNVEENSQPVFFDLFKPAWYVEQMSGWTTVSYILLAFGIGFLLAQTIAAPITPIAIWTLLAAVLGFTTTLAITNARPLNGVFGLISAIIYIVVALEAKNPADAILQGVYIILLDIPVLVMPGWAKNVNARVRKISEVNERQERFSARFWYITFTLVFILAWVALYFFEIKITHSPRPMIDSGTAAIGIVGALLTTLRFSDSYYFWIAQGLAQVVLWGITAGQGDASLVLFFTYMMYLANDGIAIFASPWFKRNLRA